MMYAAKLCLSHPNKVTTVGSELLA